VPHIQEAPGPPAEDLRELLETCDARTFDGRRDEGIIRLFVDSGLRLSELANLHLDSEDGSDVDLDSGMVRVLRRASVTYRRSMPR
jgi:site-specific recombinase XerC